MRRFSHTLGERVNRRATPDAPGQGWSQRGPGVAVLHTREGRLTAARSPRASGPPPWSRPISARNVILGGPRHLAASAGSTQALARWLLQGVGGSPEGFPRPGGTTHESPLAVE